MKKNKYFILSLSIFSIFISLIVTFPRPLYALDESNNELKVVSISYIPVKSNDPNLYLDTTIANNTWGEYNLTLSQVRNRISSYNIELVDLLERATCYKGYQDPGCESYIDYNVMTHIEHLTEKPTSTIYKATYDKYLIDYNKIATDNNFCSYVDQGIYEFWIWEYTGYENMAWESNFSSEWGDISNSDRDINDLPICSHSYTVYNYNYGREIDSAIHNHGHQFESIFRDLNYEIFENRFIGKVPYTNSTTLSARCGNVHYPPNGEADYDYGNKNYALSECINWNPEGTVSTTEINCDFWSCSHKEYLVFWMQNFPGFENGLTYSNRKMRNWWEFIVDFDRAVEDRWDLLGIKVIRRDYIKQS